MEVESAKTSSQKLHNNPSFWAVSDWLFCLSAANILFLRTWAALLEANRNVLPITYIVMLLNVLITALCLRTGYFVVQRTRSPIVRWVGILIFAGMWIIPIHAVTTIHFADDVPKRNLLYLIGLVLCAAIAASQKVRHGMVALCMILVPFTAITFGQSVAEMWAYDASRWAAPAMPSASSARAPRLVWILFDEWDYGLTFEARRTGLRLPELDRLLRESFHASKAHPPDRSTQKSVPKLITGDWTATVQNMHTRSSVFSKLKQEGFRIGVAGWFIDYCGAFASSIDTCWTSRLDSERNSMGATIPEIVLTQLRYPFENQFRSPFGQPIGARRQFLDYRFNLQSIRQAAVNPGFDFAYAHFNVPHEPFFYDASSGKNHLGETPIISLIKKDFSRYADALQLVDRTVGELRRAMETAGVWNNTYLLLTSDHPYRFRHMFDGVREDVRVPFIVRVPGASESVPYNAAFHTLLAPDLVVAILQREVRTAVEIRDWIDRRAKTAKVQ